MRVQAVVKGSPILPTSQRGVGKRWRTLLRCSKGFSATPGPRAGSAEEPAILQRHGQECGEASRGIEDPNLPLSTPTGAQLALTSPKLVEGRFSELRLDRVLGSRTSGLLPAC